MTLIIAIVCACLALVFCAAWLDERRRVNADVTFTVHQHCDECGKRLAGREIYTGTPDRTGGIG